MDFKQQLAKILEALWTYIVLLIIGLTPKMLAKIFDLANLGEYLEIEVSNESIEFIAQMTDLVVEDLYFSRPKVYLLGSRLLFPVVTRLVYHALREVVRSLKLLLPLVLGPLRRLLHLTVYITSICLGLSGDLIVVLDIMTSSFLVQAK